MAHFPESVEQYRMFELQLNGPKEGNPYQDIDSRVTATFTHEHSEVSIEVEGFYRDNGLYAIRFMAQQPGQWSFTTHAPVPELDGVHGQFTVHEATASNHGRVLLAKDVLNAQAAAIYGDELKFRFSYEDGTPYQPYGTTCYAWINQPEQVQEQTLTTLASAPFNKIRMCLFPKFYDFNSADPQYYAFVGSREEGFDFTHFNEAFFTNLDKRIEQLDALGIEADLILLHPYDKPDWGFSNMPREVDECYLSYVARRYGAYKNVWWSLANEYDLMPQKSLEDWREYARVIMTHDAFGHLRSIHNCVKLYDYNEPWCTHCSTQRIDVTRTTETIADWREAFGKPVICDEAGYEGNMYWGWGNLTGDELVRRYWEGAMRGGYVTHGECYIDRGDQIWWAHGGKLYGQSAARIEFMRPIFADVPADATPLDNHMAQQQVWPLSPTLQGEATQITPAMEKAIQYWDIPVLRSGEQYQLLYFGWFNPAYRVIPLPEGHEYTVDVIDTWNMSIETLPGTYTSSVTVNLGKQYMAVRIREVQ